MRTLTPCITFLLLLSIISSVSFAEELTIESSITPTFILLNENPKITISAICKLNHTVVKDANVTAYIRSPTGSSTSLKLGWLSDENMYAFTFYLPFSELGNYSVYIECEYGSYGASSENWFFVNELELSVIDVKPVYPGEEMGIIVEFKLNGELIIPNQNTFEVYMNNVKLESTKPPILNETNSWQELKVKIPPSTIPGSYDMKLIGKTKEGKVVVTYKNFIHVTNPLNIEVLRPILKCTSTLPCREEIITRISFYDNPVDNIVPADFNVLLRDGEREIKIPVENVFCNGFICNVLIEMVYIDVGTYTLEITLKYDGFTATDTGTVKNVFYFFGKVLNHDNKPVETKFRLTNREKNETILIATNKEGKYFTELSSGTYDIELSFPDVFLKLENVTLSHFDLGYTKGDTTVRYDSFSTLNMEELRPLKVVAVETTLPYKLIHVTIPYDNLGAEDKGNIRVYVCYNWNFGRRVCPQNEWVPIEFNISDAIHFDLQRLSTFLIGEVRELKFENIVIEKSIFKLNEPVTIKGIVVDGEDEPVEGATVSLSIPNFTSETQTITQADGSFIADVLAPSKEGSFNIMMIAKKGLFSPAETMKPIRVTRSKGLLLIVPETIKATVGKETQVKLIVSNTGQTDLSDIRIHISGISLDWYTLIPPRINYLKVNEEKEFNLSIRLPETEKYQKFYVCTVDVSSGTIKKTATFVLEVVQEIRENNTQTSGFGPLTAYISLLENTSSTLYPFILISFLFFVTILIIKEKRKKQRSSLQHRIRSIKEEVRKKKT